MLCFKEHVKCVCVCARNTKRYDLICVCVRLIAIEASAYDFRNMYFFSSKMKCSVFLLNHEIEVCMYIDLVSD
jgi:hypothetical protein